MLSLLLTDLRILIRGKMSNLCDDKKQRIMKTFKYFNGLSFGGCQKSTFECWRYLSEQ